MRTALFPSRIALAALLLAHPLPGQDNQASKIQSAPASAWAELVEVKTDIPAPEAKFGVEAHYLLEDQQVHIESESTFHRRVFKVLKPGGLQKHAQLHIPFDPAYQTVDVHFVRILREGNSIDQFDPKLVRTAQPEQNLEMFLYDGSMHALWFVQDLRVGDIVDYAWTIRGRNPVLKGKFADFLHLFSSQYVEKHRVKMICPVNRTIAFQQHGKAPEPKITTTDTEKTCLWEGDKVFLPEWIDPDYLDKENEKKEQAGKKVSQLDRYPWVQVSEFQTWKEVVDWAMPYYQNQAVADSSLQAKLQEIGEKFPDAPERIQACIRFVQDEVRYLGIEIGPNSHEPHPPAQIFKQRFGDCKDKAFLLCTMLHHFGVDAQTALVNSDLLGDTKDMIPSPFAFNHAVARYRHEGKEYWIDATLSQQGGRFDSVYFPDYKLGLPLEDATDNLKTIPANPNSLPLVLVREYYKTDSYNKPAYLTVCIEHKNFAADRFRHFLAENDFSKFRLTYSRFYEKMYEGIKPDTELTVHDNPVDNVITIMGSYKIPEFWTYSTKFKGYYCRLFAKDIMTGLSFLDFAENALESDSVAIRHPHHIRQEINLNFHNQNYGSFTRSQVRDRAFLFTAEGTKTAENGMVLTYDYQTLSDKTSPRYFSRRIGSILKNLEHSVMTYVSTAPRPPSPGTPTQKGGEGGKKFY
jgi:hypothetical protein